MCTISAMKSYIKRIYFFCFETLHALFVFSFQQRTLKLEYLIMKIIIYTKLNLIHILNFTKIINLQSMYNVYYNLSFLNCLSVSVIDISTGSLSIDDAP